MRVAPFLFGGASAQMDFSVLSDGRDLMRHSTAERQTRRITRRKKRRASKPASPTRTSPARPSVTLIEPPKAEIEDLDVADEDLDETDGEESEEAARIRRSRRMSAFLDFHPPSEHESDAELERPITAIGNFAYEAGGSRVLRTYGTVSSSRSEEHATYDHTGKTLYLDLCKRSGVIPTSYYLRHMNDARLDLRHFGLGATGLRPICASLAGNTTVLSLDLTDNWLDFSGGLYLCDMMRENCYISHLILSDNHLNVEIAEQLAEVLGSNAQLTHLCLAGNEFCDKAATHLADLLASSPRLVTLDLSRNDFGEQAGVMFGRAIGENSVMLDLDLSWNHIRARGAKAIAAGLSANTCLKKLNIGWNGFGPVMGASEIGKALKVNMCLEELDITNNRIVAEGAVLLGKGLTCNTSLKTLKVGKNPMQTAGCYGILSAIVKNAENTAMECLVLQDVLVNEDFRELEKNAKEQLSNLAIEIGPKLIQRQKAAIHPMVKLRRYIERHNIRLIDFFNNIDTDRSMSVTREEFIEGLKRMIKETGLKFSDEEMEVLMGVLDKDGDGEVNYSELVTSNSQFTELEKKHNLTMNSINVR